MLLSTRRPIWRARLGAALVAVSSLFNGAGRFLWGAASDRIGRSRTFRVMLASEVLVFGSRLMPAVYGAVLTAWAAAGVIGPQIFAALQDRMSATGASTWSFIIAGGFVILGLALSFLLSDTRKTAIDIG